MKKKLIITGGQGYIASLVNEFSEDYDILRLGRKDLDLADTKKVREFFDKADFDLVFHAGAMAQTQECEDMPELTYKVNVLSTKAIADVCKQKGKRLIFTSTEQVFNGRDSGAPFVESDEPKSLSAYGNHKIEAEQYLQEIDGDHIILRFSWMFGLGFPKVKPSPNILKQVLDSLFLHKEAKYTVNELRGFTYAHKFAQNFDRITRLPKGTYHVSSENSDNTYDVANKIADLLGFDQNFREKFIKPNFEKYKDKSRDFRMDAQKIKHAGINFGSVESNLRECLVDFGWLKYD